MKGEDEIEDILKDEEKEDGMALLLSSSASPQQADVIFRDGWVDTPAHPDIENMKQFLTRRRIQIFGGEGTVTERIKTFFDMDVPRKLLYFSGPSKNLTGDWAFGVGELTSPADDIENVEDQTFLNYDTLVKYWDERNKRDDIEDRLYIIADTNFSGTWVEILKQRKKSRTENDQYSDIEMQASCKSTESCTENDKGGIFSQAYMKLKFNHKKDRSQMASIWQGIWHPIVAVNLWRSDSSTKQNNPAFTSFSERYHFSPTATVHGHIPIGKGLHIGPARCWGNPRPGVQRFMEAITVDSGGTQLSRREDVEKKGGS